MARISFLLKKKACKIVLTQCVISCFSCLWWFHLHLWGLVVCWKGNRAFYDFIERLFRRARWDASELQFFGHFWSETAILLPFLPYYSWQETLRWFSDCRHAVSFVYEWKVLSEEFLPVSDDVGWLGLWQEEPRCRLLSGVKDIWILFCNAHNCYELPWRSCHCTQDSYLCLVNVLRVGYQGSRVS